MKTATVRQLRHDFGSVLNWVQEGEEVEIRKRGEVVARLTPPPRNSRKVARRPNFAARLKRIFGDKILPGNIVVEERERSNW